MAKIKKCPWCGAEGVEAKESSKKNVYVTVIERRCPECNKVLAAYSKEQGNFLPNIRVFKD